ncbi:glycoside hydrolase family 32 protein [Halobacillus sp. H74]|uniref:glycoside hydrolase family 32 protein n=1 Tax=Halobacillus sp. H74 TaxID=3457436 RepID=UPI003FCC9C8C
MRASDDQELVRQANSKFNDDETYKRYRWDASEFIGEVLYIKAVDQSTSGWGHINLDDFNVYNEGPMPTDIDQVAEEPESDEIRQSGTIKDWSAITGEWVPSTHGSNGGIWECPALVELPIDGDPTNTKWVLQVSINDGAPAGGSGMQYFVGDFDGKTFTNESPSEKILWTDYGADYYAAVDWNGIEGENGEKYWLGWMSNWQYANHTPTTTWRGSGTLPRQMELTQTEEGPRLKQTPISLNSIQDKSNAISYQNKKASELNNHLTEFSGTSYELIAEFDISNTNAKEFGFKVRKGEKEYTTIGYEVDDKTLFVDRTHSGAFDYGSNVLENHEGPLSIENETVKMHIFIDRSSIEVFGNNGETVITDQIFPDPSSQGLEVYSNSGDVTLKSLDIYPLDSIWNKKSGFQSKLTSWEPISGNWADTMNGKQGQSSGDSFILSAERGSDFKYEADIKILDSDSHPDDPSKDLVGNLVGAGALVFRSDSSGENSYVVNIDAKHNQVKLIKFANGLGTDLAAYNHGNIKTNKSYRLKVDVSGAHIKAYLDNNLVIDTKDQSYKEGHLGLNVWDATVLYNKVKFKPDKNHKNK